MQGGVKGPRRGGRRHDGEIKGGLREVRQKMSKKSLVRFSSRGPSFLKRAEGEEAEVTKVLELSKYIPSLIFTELPPLRRREKWRQSSLKLMNSPLVTFVGSSWRVTMGWEER